MSKSPDRVSTNNSYSSKPQTVRPSPVIGKSQLYELPQNLKQKETRKKRLETQQQLFNRTDFHYQQRMNTDNFANIS